MGKVVQGTAGKRLSAKERELAGKLSLLADCDFDETDLLHFIAQKNLVEEFYEYLGETERN